MKNNQGKNNFGEVLFKYTRKQAIDDGLLIDVSKMAQEAGFKYPAAVTRAVWYDYIKPNEDLKGYGQSTEGRLWDTLTMLCFCIVHGKGKKISKNALLFDVLFLMNGNNKPKRKLVTLKAVCGPDDDRKPVFTIMKPNED